MQPADTLELSIQLSPDYASRYLTLVATVATLCITLDEGEHTVSTPLLPIGRLNNFGHRPLLASFTLWYRYDAALRQITLCSADLVSKDAPTLTTYAQGAQQGCSQRGYAEPARAENAALPWDHRLPLYPGLEQALRSVVRANAEAVAASAIAAGLNVAQRTPPPQLQADLYARLCAVYHKGKFLEFFDPDKEYGSDHVLRSLESTWFGTLTMAANVQFANIIGSTNDPKINGMSWLSLWSSQFGACAACTSYNTAGYPGSPPGAFNCTPSGRLYGGHTLFGAYAASEPRGSNNVMIIPICPAHNNDDNVYMVDVSQRQAILLYNYFNLDEYSAQLMSVEGIT
jgi:hypothetical protein